MPVKNPHQCILVTSSDSEVVFCLAYQEEFGGSCFEFVAVKHNFLSAQGWCERAGGHLAFIQNEGTQQFLQRHLQSEQNWWIGLVSTSTNITLGSPGPLSWLDGSNISYSNWVKQPWLGAGCGFILRDSEFQWEPTDNCSQELHFICQFESKRSLACADHSAMLQCGFGQVIEISNSFYGRNNIHYCHEDSASFSAPKQTDCRLVDVSDFVADHCDGLQVCQASANAASIGEPCPHLGSYLSVEYHCNNGLRLSMQDLAAVFDNITINVKWLLPQFQGNLTCTLNGGNGLQEDLEPQNSISPEATIIYQYQTPGVFTVEVDCSTSGLIMTAQKNITIQEPLGEFGAIKCYSINNSMNSEKCVALHGNPVTIQVELKAATGSTLEGVAAQNITLGLETMQLFSQGYHQFTILASNGVTTADVSLVLNVFLMEPVGGLEAFFVSQQDHCPSDLHIIVSLEHGAPAQLLFYVSGTNNSFSETKMMTEDHVKVFNISPKIQGDFKYSFMEHFHIFNVSGIRPDLTSGHAEFIIPVLTSESTTASPTTLASPPLLSCSIFPQVGHILAPFKISCIAPPSFCLPGSCTYCFETASGKKPSISPADIILVVMPTCWTCCHLLQVSTWTAVITVMMSFGMNPFTWSDSQHVNDTVGALSLSTENGSSISVTNLAQEFEIFLPRSEVLQLNSTFLDLRNFSTLMINVTTPNITLVLKLDPSEDVPLHLLLGFQGYPNDTNYNAQTQLPLEGKTQGDIHNKHTLNQGIYYLLVRPIVGPGVNSTNATVSVTSIAAQCMYWDESHSLWCDSGCRVGPLTTPLVTQCLCNHLTFFGSSFFVMPNTIDLSQIGQLFASFANNPVVVCFVGAILLTYLLVVLWARRQDIQDEAKIKVTVLADNDPLAEYRYLLSISTGHRPRASTSSQVTVTLIGSEGQSEPHHLTATNKPVFYRGAVDMFLLTTPSSLGDLHSIRLWHDNSGHNPSWYVNKVTVQDMETEQKWHFLCDTWLAIDIGEGLLDKVFAVATETDLKGFSNIFFTKTEKDFNDVHLWYSIVNRPATSSFTRVQRTSCCFSMLMCAMLTSIMFYGVPTDPSEQEMEIGQIEFSWQQVMIGIESSLLMFPVNFVIVFLFRNVRQREKKNKNDGEQNPKTTFCKQGKTGKDPSQSRDSLDVHKEVTPDTVIQQIIHTLFKTQKSSSSWVQMTPDRTTDINTLLLLAEDLMQQQKDREQDTFDNSNTAKLQRQKLYDPYLYWQLQNLENNLGKLDSACFLNPESINQALQQIYAIKTHLETQLETVCNTKPLPQVPHSQKENHAKKGLPWWFIFVAWFLVIASTGVSAFFTMLYGLKYGKVRSISWLISTVVSFFQSLFITEPLKVLGLAIFFALVLKRVEKEENNVNFELSTADLDAASRRDSSCHLYKPPPPTNIEKMKKMMIQEQKMFTLIREILVYTGFMWMLLSVAYSQREPSAFFLNQHIQQSFSNNITDSMSLSDVFSWVNTTLLDNLFGEYTGFITDGNSRLVGNARFRQVRVRQDSCPLAQSMRGSVTDCHAPYSWEAEDTGAYWAGWNHSFQMNTSDAALIPWRYQTQSKLRSPTVWGNMAVYRGGGFVMDLGLEKQDAKLVCFLLLIRNLFFQLSVQFSTYLTTSGWTCTLVHFLWNLQCTMPTSTSSVYELQTVRLYQATDGLQIFAMISEVVYIIFILYYMCEQVGLSGLKWAHFKTKWNLVDLSIIALSWSAMGVFIKRTILGNRDVENHQNHKDEYVSFHDTATADDMLGYLIALLVLLATIKLWHLMRLNSKLHLITSILQRAWTQISSYLVVISIMLLAYSIACNLLYGWKLYSYKTLQDSAMTLVNLQLGIFNYDEVMDTNPVLSAFLIGSCIIFMTFIVLNLFISAILHAFSQEKLHHQALEEAEIVDLMLLKLCSLIGIRTKTK
uniref:Polycystic kidney disease 1 like 2a n=1 Tax=Denticeps clupeoides TaxID=299321 RepID=A0AAY4BKQ8_9TELE